MTQPNNKKIAVLQELILILEARLSSESSSDPDRKMHRLAVIELLAEFRMRTSAVEGEFPPEAIDRLNSSEDRANEYIRKAGEFLSKQGDGYRNQQVPNSPQ
jgi:hypothetical protein